MHARLVVAAAALSVLAAASPPVSAQSSTVVDCSAPRGVDERRACEAARKGTAPLRRFAEATRRIYAIHVPDYLATALDAERAQARAGNAEATQVAAVK